MGAGSRAPAGSGRPRVRPEVLEGVAVGDEDGVGRVVRDAVDVVVPGHAEAAGELLK